MQTPRMPKSKCRYCVPAVLFDNSGKVWKGFYCEIDEWDADTECRPNQCGYYRKKISKVPKNEIFSFREGGQMKMPELNPCPFCGKKACPPESNPDGSWSGAFCSSLFEARGKRLLNCCPGDLGWLNVYTSLEEAIAAWNRRAPSRAEGAVGAADGTAAAKPLGKEAR